MMHPLDLKSALAILAAAPRHLITLGGLGLVTALYASSQEVDWGGRLGLESRSFFESGAFPGQEEQFHPSLFGEVEADWGSDDRRHRFEAKVFGRVEAEDDERSHIDVREAYYEFASDAGWFLLAGIAKEFWGVTESRHLVDVINQVDSLEDIDEEDRLGQPMVKLYMQRDWGDLELFVLPGFRERAFAGSKGRLRLPIAVNEDLAIYESSAEERHVDFAVRYSHYIGAFDFGIAAFQGTSREPRFAATNDGRLSPIYDQMTQLSLDAQYTSGPWLLKLEALWRDQSDDEFSAGVAGFEYSFFQAFNSAADIGVIAEYQYDGRKTGRAEDLFTIGAETPAPATIADNDLFAGMRVALNDTQSTTLLIGSGVDLSTGASLTIAEAERRIGEDWTIEVEARFFNGAENDFISLFERDDYISIGFSRHF